MLTTSFTCPRCLRTIAAKPGAKFCPHCGLPDAQTSASDASPVNLKIGQNSYHVLEKIAVGSVSTVYRCQFEEKGKIVESICKMGRDARVNGLLENEAAILKKLHTAGTSRQFTPMLPRIVASANISDGSTESARHANVLRFDEALKTSADLYSLIDVKNQYPNGLDPQNVAWIWRRLLSVLGFIHSNSVIHTAVLPMHVLIEPREHMLALVDWCCAVQGGPSQGVAFRVIAGGFAPWYRKVQGSTRPAATPMLDISFAARCMIELLGGDPVSPSVPATVDPAVARHFRHVAEIDSSQSNAWKILNDFETLTEALWGPKKFSVMVMPPKAGSPQSC